MKNIIASIRILTMTAIALLAFGPPNPGQAAQTKTDQFSCTNVTEIPQIECEALVAIYNSTDGVSWNKNRGWLRITTPCTWFGVTCSNEHVTILNFSSNGLVGTLPAELGNLSSLVELDLIANQLNGIPSEISKLSSLTKLSLWGNQLSSFPTEILNLSNLQELKLGANPFSSVPLNIDKLSKLTVLSLDSSNLSDFPIGVLGLSNLTELQLGSNKLSNIPSKINNLSNLTNLDLSQNQLSSIPSEIGDLPKLEFLSIWMNQLTSIPPEIGNLSQLTSLDLNSNLLSTLPSEIGNLSNLYNLGLANNLLSNFPAGILNFSNLSWLYLNGNQLSKIPSEIDNLSSLTILFIGGDSLSNIPPEIGNLSNLQSLGIEGGEITNIPTEIFGLTNLTYLSVSNSQLSSVPPEINNLSNLTALTLESNQFTTFPSEILTLSQLTDLNLRFNQLNNIPAEITDLSKLKYLRLRSNQLNTLPPEIISHSNLEYISLNYNLITIDDRDLLAFINEKSYNWAETQTIAPIGLVATTLSDNSILFEWKPVAFQDKGGYYEISIATDEAFVVHGVTIDKIGDSYTITDLLPSTTYNIRIRTYTPAHDGESPGPEEAWDDQLNELWSEYSEIISATTLDPVPTPTNTPTATHTATAISTPTNTPVSTNTPTYTPPPPSTVTSTNVPTATHIATPTSTHIPANTRTAHGSTPPPQGTHEPDDNCPDATAIQPNSTSQTHTFHKLRDVDWIKFEGQADTTYRIEIIVPDSSQADVVLDLYPDCQSVSDIGWDKSFSPDVRLDFTAPATDPIYLRLANHQAEVYGPEVSYQLTVRPLVEEGENRALIIVAGRYEIGDPLQENIHYVTDLVYRTFQAYGYGDDNIRYLATDSGLTGYDDPADLHHLEAAITNWAAKQLTAGGVLNIYMMDHGNVDKFYLDEPADEVLTPTDLDGWLSQLEDEVPDLRINIMIEACQSGSFISLEGGSISRPGRLVVTSTNDTNDAYASPNGAYFSDQYLAWLHRGFNLAASFREARSAAHSRTWLQDAWLDANGNGIPNEFDDATAAALVGFGIANSFNSNWPPHIFSAQPPAMLDGFSGTIYADVRDDHNVRQVSATIYPPSYTPPETRNQLIAEPLTEIILNRQASADGLSSSDIAQENRYAATYNFVEEGTYRIIINAEDREGLSARSLEITFSTGKDQLYLPLIRR